MKDQRSRTYVKEPFIIWFFFFLIIHLQNATSGEVHVCCKTNFVNGLFNACLKLNVIIVINSTILLSLNLKEKNYLRHFYAYSKNVIGKKIVDICALFLI